MWVILTITFAVTTWVLLAKSVLDWHRYKDKAKVDKSTIDYLEKTLKAVRTREKTTVR